MALPRTMAFLGMSLDGFISGPDDALDWLERGGGPAEDNGFADFLASVDGGRVVSQYLSAGLLDELTVSILPVVIGRGIRLFEDAGPERWLDLAASRVFGSGMVQLRYTERPSPAGTIT